MPSPTAAPGSASWWLLARKRGISAWMSPLDEIVRVAVTRGLDFLVCGGHAVNAYQVIRKTGDLDLVVRERDVTEWRGHLEALGYAVFHEDTAFLQLSPPTTTGWPIDLLVVDDGTLDAMKHAARPFTFGAAACLIPSVEHLIAMKLHAPVDMILAASAAMLPIWNADPHREATRLAEKCRVRFALGPRD